MKLKQKIYGVIEGNDTKLGKAYNVFMIIVIILSIFPLFFYRQRPFFYTLDIITTTIFIIDYILRLFTADVKAQKGISSYLFYPLRPMAIIDLLSILPTIIALNSAFRMLRLLRLFRALRVIKFFRYSRNLRILGQVFKSQRKQFILVISLAISYILISALLVFQVEPNTFHTFFKAVYWATISLTTVGYGDIYPVSTMGRVISMLSSFLGIAIVALPAGIIVEGYREVLQDKPHDN